jgi:hypothetical protein
MKYAPMHPWPLQRPIRVTRRRGFLLPGLGGGAGLDRSLFVEGHGAIRLPAPRAVAPSGWNRTSKIAAKRSA